MNLKIEYKAKVSYRVVVTTEGVKDTNGTRRGSVILVDPLINVQPLKERTRGKTELIGVKIVGDSEGTYNDSFELGTAYSGPYSTEITVFTKS